MFSIILYLFFGRDKNLPQLDFNDVYDDRML
jgi:hypothetical protein